ncbi:hypothetical protein HPB51_018850 [Rhipicephalus microplus]|uniref:Uncharacterized protein n=1 Tax=Rhipicephalus microplus TaxID=6941 RepID=A0A9J6DNP0_RHIMP|nr:hypothetical protein HPB51_018850 [Rhipicephalus microplus]
MQKFGVFGSEQFAVKGGALRMETACALYISLLSALTALGKRRDCGWEECPRRFQLFRLICRNLSNRSVPTPSLEISRPHLVLSVLGCATCLELIIFLKTRQPNSSTKTWSFPHKKR